jgi:aspartate-semialdehyde dehydrogenase
MGYKIAIAGATGMVGRTILKVLEERAFPVDTLIPIASERSIGSNIKFDGQEIPVVGWEQGLAEKPDIALFSAGGGLSIEYAPKFAAKGIRVIDNSSAFRMDADKKLVVPEVNGDCLESSDKIIANPNCSTIQMLVALAPIHQKFGIKRIVVSTYQSITGSGAKAVKQMEAERKGEDAEKAYPHPIDLNCLPHCDVFLDNGYTKEEMKLVNETHKILNDPTIGVTATAVRVPVVGGHSEAVNIETTTAFELNQILDLLQNAQGISLLDDPENNKYPMPLLAEGKNDVFVGRIRKDESQGNTLNMWIVSDNLRKGAATNAVQIAEYLIKKGWI